jgi:hypothetical protein
MRLIVTFRFRLTLNGPGLLLVLLMSYGPTIAAQLAAAPKGSATAAGAAGQRTGPVHLHGALG